MSSKFKKKIAERPTEELLDILARERDAYPREVISIIEEVLQERDVDPDRELSEGESVESSPRPITDRGRSSSVSENTDDKYRTLKSISTIMVVCCFVFLIGAGIFAFFFSEGDIMRLLAVLLAAIILVVPYFAFTRLINLFVDMADENRRTRKLLGRLLRKKE